MEYVITFKNTNHAIKSEQYLLREKLHATVMPLPAQVRAGCGICLRLPPEEIRKALGVLTENNVAETNLYSRTEIDHQWVYSEVTDRSVL
jgi:hypothetical protein